MNILSNASRRSVSYRFALVSALLLTGCTTSGPLPSATGRTSPTPAAGARESLGRFVGAATGQDGTITLADGRTARVQVLRAYVAASGRECREVLLGGSTAGQSSVICQSDGQWAVTRPLLGNGAGRP